MDIREVKKSFYDTYRAEVEKVGYNMALGIGRQDDRFSLEVRLQPLDGSPHPISEDLLERIKNDVLPSTYKDTPVNVVYLGIIQAR